VTAPTGPPAPGIKGGGPLSPNRKPQDKLPYNNMPQGNPQGNSQGGLKGKPAILNLQDSPNSKPGKEPFSVAPNGKPQFPRGSQPSQPRFFQEQLLNASINKNKNKKK
jgi:hypothetical protein